MERDINRSQGQLSLETAIRLLRRVKRECIINAGSDDPQLEAPSPDLASKVLDFLAGGKWKQNVADAIAEIFVKDGMPLELFPREKVIAALDEWSPLTIDAAEAELDSFELEENQNETD